MLFVGWLPAWAESGDDQPAGGEPAAPAAMMTPAMNGPLVANPNPTSFNAGPFGPVYMTGAISGLGLWQNNISSGDQHSLASLSNGVVSVKFSNLIVVLGGTVVNLLCQSRP